MSHNCLKVCGSSGSTARSNIMATLEYIRRYYGMPWLKNGMRVTVHGKGGRFTRVCATAPYVFIRLDGESFSRRYHPHDEDIVYDRQGILVHNKSGVLRHKLL